MSDPQIIRTPKGEELVVIPRAEYDALLAAAADAAVYDARKADLAAGRDARLPPEVSAAMLRGDSLLKALRKWRGMSQKQICEQTGIGQGYLSDLEAGRRSGTRNTLKKIQYALDIDPNWIVSEGNEADSDKRR